MKSRPVFVDLLWHDPGLTKQGNALIEKRSIFVSLEFPSLLVRLEEIQPYAC